MPNPNYRAGRKREYQAMKELETLGWLLVRSSGSHSAIDLVAINWGMIRLIQVKPHKDKKAGIKELQSFKINPMVDVTKELWTYHKGEKDFEVETIK